MAGWVVESIGVGIVQLVGGSRREVIGYVDESLWLGAYLSQRDRLCEADPEMAEEKVDRFAMGGPFPGCVDQPAREPPMQWTQVWGSEFGEGNSWSRGDWPMDFVGG